YKNTDGVPLKGLLLKPGNFDPKKKYPMIIYIYERLTQGLHAFRNPAPGTSINPTFYVSNGYLIFMPDIVYTTGYPGRSALQCVHSQSRIGGSLWEYPMRYLENSPLFHIDKVQTPLLLINNDEDDAVPFQQGIEFFLALRRLNKEAYMFSYNGEKHGLRKRMNQKDYTHRLQEFFDHFLKGAPAPEWMEKGIPYLQREKEKEKYRVA